MSGDRGSAHERDGPAPPAPQGMLHEAYFYAEKDRYLADLLRFVHGGLAHNEPVLIAVPGPHLEQLRAALPPNDTARVQMRDMAVAGRNPGRILGSVFEPFIAEHPGRRVRIVSEAIWPERTDEEYPACAEHEALVNLALARTAVHIVCPYDATNLPSSVLADATRTHPTLARDDGRHPSPSYEDPGTAAAAFDQPLTTPPEDSEIVVINTVTGPRTARRVAYEFATRIGLSPQRRTDLMITVHELAVNTILHAGGTGLLSIWTTGEHVVVQIDDGGQINDPLAGRRLPGPSERGHGLHVVHQIADLVRVHRNGDGTSVRAYFKRMTP